MSETQEEVKHIASCSICYSTYNQKAGKIPLVLPCGHTFCNFCLCHTNFSCPVCKTEVDLRKPQIINYAIQDLSELFNSGPDQPKTQHSSLIPYINQINNLIEQKNIDFDHVLQQKTAIFEELDIEDEFLKTQVSKYFDDHYQKQTFILSPICPHSLTLKMTVFSNQDPECQICQEKEQNMQCVTCQQIFCGRFKKCHMLEHFNKTGHPIIQQLLFDPNQVNYWCYLCNNYLYRDHDLQ